MLEVLSFCDQERDYPPLIKKTVLTFLVKKKYNKAFWNVYYSRVNFQSYLFLVVVLLLESKGPY